MCIISDTNTNISMVYQFYMGMMEITLYINAKVKSHGFSS